MKRVRRLFVSCLALLMTATAWADVEVNEETFPDEVFRNWLMGRYIARDGILTDDELAIFEELDLKELGIKSLKGIEYFTELTELDVSQNELTELDVSQNTKLQYLFCTSNKLTSLDVSANKALLDLMCNNNQLTKLDVSNNTALLYLNCYDNKLTELDVSKNTQLYDIMCGYNQLTTLDVSKNTQWRKQNRRIIVLWKIKHCSSARKILIQ